MTAGAAAVEGGPLVQHTQTVQELSPEQATENLDGEEVAGACLKPPVALGAAAVETGHRISAAEARRLACNAAIIPMVLGGDSMPLDFLWNPDFRHSLPLAVGLAAIGTGYAQGRIGSAGAGVIAEKPELIGNVILLVAIPETVIILGFAVLALVIAGPS